MNYGMYLSAAGVLTNMHRMDVMANNLANLGTVGFKADEVTFMTRAPERLDPGALSMMGGEPADPQWMLERLGGGQWAAPSRIDLRQGSLQRTGGNLDAAIEGDGFFVVGSEDAPRLTRDTRCHLPACWHLPAGRQPTRWQRPRTRLPASAATDDRPAS